MKQRLQNISQLVLATLVVLAGSNCVWAQQVSTKPPTAPPPPSAAPSARKPRQVSRPVVPVVVVEPGSAPQVVTILHRLNGLKILRLLLRSSEGIDGISKLDDAFKIKDEMHTSVIAGVAMGDGETIVAKLPQADAELGPAMAPTAPFGPQSLQAPPGMPGIVGGVGSLFDRPDLTVIGRDGKRLFARYIGLDGVTGLSVLKLTGHSTLNLLPDKEQPVALGQRLRLLAPEPVGQSDLRILNKINVRIGESEARVIGATRTASGTLARIKIASKNLTSANIGGVALTVTGDTLGIVEAVNENEATLLPNPVVHGAAKRVLEKQASVPRPWLGIRGEPLGTFPVEQMVRGGWQPEKAKSLLEAHRGIFLTSVMPNSPAAGAALRPGDVILRVNETEVKNADEFSWSLEEIGAGDSVNFTVARPGQTITEAVEVTLGDSPVGFFGSTEDETPTPGVNVERIVRSFSGATNSLNAMLMSEGIETIALKPAVALRFGAGSGLLVIYVNPNTVAYKAGLRTGDVIESVDGHQVLSDTIKPKIANATDYSLSVVRNREKMIFKIAK